MIQRIQTRFLLFALIGNLLLFILPLGNVADGNIELFATGFQSTVNMPITSMLPLLIINSFLALFTIITIFSYKKRHRQMKFCKINFLFSLFLVLYVLFILPDFIIPSYYSEEALNSSFAAFIPVLIMLLYMVAMHFIRKDISLIASSDRIR